MVFLSTVIVLTLMLSFRQYDVNKLALTGVASNGSEISAEFIVTEDNYTGTANFVEGEDSQNVTVSGYDNDPQPLSITTLTESNYQVEMDNEISCNLTVVNVEDGIVTCGLSGSNEDSQFDLNFTFESNEIRSETDFSWEAGEVHAIPIWPAIVGIVVTVGSCAYERTAQSVRCTESAQNMANQCQCTCSYSYSYGWCGGNCSVQCN